VIAGSCDNNIYIVRGADGGLERSFDAGSHAAASPAADSGFIVAGTYGGEVVAADPIRGEVIWRFESPQRSAFFSSPALTADRVFIGCRDNRLYALRRADGSVAWTFAAGDAVDGSPVLCGDLVLAGSDDGRLVLLRADDGREVWRADLGAAIPGFPAVTADWVVAADADGWLHAFRSAEPPAGDKPSTPIPIPTPTPGRGSQFGGY
jgi:outer membrane protein assembly factor BamB